MAEPLLSPIKNQSVVDHIIDRLLNLIMCKKYAPGAKIPTETELSEQFQVSRNSVREAIKVLVAMGILEIRRSEGTFVCTSSSPRMLSPILFGIVLQENSYIELLRLRKILETGILYAASIQATEEDLQELDKTYERLSQVFTNPDSTLDEIIQMDLLFHNTIAKLTHNNMMYELNRSVLELAISLGVYPFHEISDPNNWPSVLGQHRRLYSAVRNRMPSPIGEMIFSMYEDNNVYNYGDFLNKPLRPTADAGTSAE